MTITTQLTMTIEIRYQATTELIAKAYALLIGAGTGVDSGLQNLRGNASLLGAYLSLGQADLEFANVGSPRPL